jgi:pimeloyl-ACP methyl ester carboxylesterase
MILLHSQILGTGKPLLVLHGFLGMSDNWRTMGKQWAAHLEVHLIDLRNHGRSFHSDTFSYADMAADLTAYCDHHQLQQVVVLGHSMGGKLAMHYATTNPKQVEKLIVADIAPKAYPPHHDHILEGLMDLHTHPPESRSDADQRLSQFVTNRGTRLFLLKNLYRNPDGFALRLNTPVLQSLVGEVMVASDAIYSGSTLFLAGEKSDYILPQDHAQIASQFPQAIIKTIPKAGHWLHAENPIAFAAEVADFLAID